MQPVTESGCGLDGNYCSSLSKELYSGTSEQGTQLGPIIILNSAVLSFREVVLCSEVLSG